MTLDRELLWHRWPEVDRLFAEAMEQPASEQQRFLEAACGDDQELLDLVTGLLELERDSDGQLDAPEERLSMQFVARVGNDRGIEIPLRSVLLNSLGQLAAQFPVDGP